MSVIYLKSVYWSNQSHHINSWS